MDTVFDVVKPLPDFRVRITEIKTRKSTEVNFFGNGPDVTLDDFKRLIIEGVKGERMKRKVVKLNTPDGRHTGDIIADKYLIYRDSRKHFFRKGQGYPIADQILQKLKMMEVKTIELNETTMDGLRKYIVPLKDYLNAPLFQEKEFEPQRCLPLSKMEMIKDSADPVDDIFKIKKIFKQVFKKGTEERIDTIIYLCKNERIEEETVLEWIENNKKIGDYIEPRVGVLKKL